MMDSLLKNSRRAQQMWSLMIDVVMIEVALWAAFSLRYNAFYIPQGYEYWLWIMAPLLAVPIFLYFGLYRTVIRYIGFNSLWVVFQAISLYALLWGLAALISGIQIVPRSAIMINWLVCLFLLGGVRMIARWWLAGRAPGIFGAKIDGRKNVIIYGAGAAGFQLSIALSVSREMRPMAFVDDDMQMIGQQINGIRVYSSTQIGRLIDEFSIKEILLALPSASRQRRQEILSRIEPFAVVVQTLPDISELEECRVDLNDIRDINIIDLLERDPIAPLHDLLHANITGKVVMVTGAGGSIGAELCRQILKLNPTKVILFEQNEFNLYNIGKELRDNYKKCISILGSVVDHKHVEKVLKQYKVETIYHAAAYKHVPLVECNVVTGVENNVIGTYNTAHAALSAAVETFVMISTDKAVRPTNIMGASKRFSELLLQSLSKQSDQCKTRFSVVRFGNVLGSSGSVVPLFREQIARGGPVTVTHPEIIRYFMTANEATQLVLQAGAMGCSGDVFVLDMGEPLKILSLAKRMIHLSGLEIEDEQHQSGDIKIEFSGLRQGEKLFEELLLSESVHTTLHPRILCEQKTRVNSARINQYLSQLKNAIDKHDDKKIRNLLFDVIENYSQPIAHELSA